MRTPFMILAQLFSGDFLKKVQEFTAVNRGSKHARGHVGERDKAIAHRRMRSKMARMSRKINRN